MDKGLFCSTMLLEKLYDFCALELTGDREWSFPLVILGRNTWLRVLKKPTYDFWIASHYAIMKR